MAGAAISALQLEAAEAAAIDRLVDDTMLAWKTRGDADAVVAMARELAGELPSRVREALDKLAADAAPPAVLISGFPLRERPATPERWSVAADDRSSVALLLIGEALGASFGWATQQDGRLVHDIVPTAGDEHVQLGSNSTETLTLHTEDAFHPFRAEWIALLCLRNPKKVATLLGAIDTVELTHDEWAALREPAFPLLADLSHHASQAAHRSADGAPTPEAESAYVPTLAWDERRGVESLRYDPFYTGPARTARHAAALKSLAAQFERNIVEVSLGPGELLVLDNHRTVHGRAAFTATYGDDERWLKRVCVTGDLAGSGSARHSTTCRVVGCNGLTCEQMLDLTGA